MQSDQSESNSLNNVSTRSIFTRTTFLKLNRFDRNVAFILVVLLALTGVIVLLGDRVGVTLQRVAPLGVARSTSFIILQFSETMNRVTVPPTVKVVQIPPDKLKAL